MDHRLAILCGGGPAPGINSVISAAAIRGHLDGIGVLGIEDGFQWLMSGDTEHVRALGMDSITRIHFTGGSIIGTSRANPTTSVDALEMVVGTLVGRLGVDKLITIGGDDTAFSALRVAEQAHGRLRIAHVPKTIDNDLDLPHGISTFGYQTARHVGVGIVKNLMVDAKTTNRWYVVVTMGRKAGHLALGIGKAAGATLTLIPEEFPERRVRLDQIADVLVGAIIKRRAEGKGYGVAVLAEGLAEFLVPDDLAQFGAVGHDEHGHLRLAEVDLVDAVKVAVRQRLAALDLPTTIVTKDIGYELRCADPVPYDMEYTRDLGYCATQFLLDGGRDAMVTMQDGHFVAMPFTDLLDSTTGATRVRLVDTRSEQYQIARGYMVRLTREDFQDETSVAGLAAAAHLTAAEFRQQFGHVVAERAPTE